LIKRLRQRIEAEAGSPRYIITVSGGYQFFPEGRPEK
jgi:DNA-binding response OmpR family regulator